MSKKEKVATRASVDESRVSLSNLQTVLVNFFGQYQEKTAKRIKIIDSFCMLCIVLTIIPMAYCFLVGAFPMNSLLSGVFAPLGTLIFTVCLRFQVNDESKYNNITEQKAFWEYLFCMIAFYLAIINFLG